VINLQRVFLSHTDRDWLPQNLNMQKDYRRHKESKSIAYRFSKDFFILGQAYVFLPHP
jgi:hypothetical protein